MPLNARNTRQRHRCIWGGRQETVTLLARGNNVWEPGGVNDAVVVRSVTLFRCLWGPIDKSGSILDNERAAYMDRRLTIPRSEMDRVGVPYINAAFFFVDKFGRFWTATASPPIHAALFENYISMTCHRIDPPNLVYTER